MAWGLLYEDWDNADTAAFSSYCRSSISYGVIGTSLFVKARRLLRCVGGERAGDIQYNRSKLLEVWSS
jgi:hypothetical protein